MPSFPPPLPDYAQALAQVRALVAPADPASPVPLYIVPKGGVWPPEDVRARRWLSALRFTGKAGSFALLPGGEGALGGVALGGGEDTDPVLLRAGVLPLALPPGDYAFAEPGSGLAHALGWLLGAYRFGAFLPAEAEAAPRIALAEGTAADAIVAQAAAVWFARDLINLPAETLGPAQLAEAAAGLAAHFGAGCTITEGAALTEGFPLIAAVGRASPRAPRLVDMNWGEPGARKITLVGKGVTFDTGGLNLKPDAAMALMKKDMGGAATALALAAMIMAARLPVALRVIIPIADNDISGGAFRPGDVLRARSGTTVEISNTDAEGRLLLADALTLAAEDAPDLIISLATLTGAARVALGPDLPALFASEDAAAAGIMAAGIAVDDPVWRLPLWRRYADFLKSRIASVNHAADTPFAGAITAALFLSSFTGTANWVHLDLFAWTPVARPGRPQGGEPQGARALFAWLKGPSA